MPHPSVPEPGLYVVETEPHRYLASGGGESPTFLGARKFSAAADAALAAESVGGRAVPVPAYLLDPLTRQYSGGEPRPAAEGGADG